jgi:hypothetical protein
MTQNRFPTLLQVFLRDLVRRRSLWVLAALLVAAVLVDNWVSVPGSQPGPASVAGHELVRAQAVFKLRTAVIVVRQWAILAVIVFSVLLAPESRRNGTTSFLLCLGVGRLPLAAAQYAALALFLSAGALIVHAGYSLAALPLDETTPSQALLGWFPLLAPWLAMTAAAFALSLALGAIETVTILIAIPLAAFVAAGLLRDSGSAASFLVPLLDHIRMMFPDPGRLAAYWPHPPEGDWPAAQSFLSIAFWTALGLWLYSRRDLGSRAATV